MGIRRSPAASSGSSRCIWSCLRKLGLLRNFCRVYTKSHRGENTGWRKKSKNRRINSNHATKQRSMFQTQATTIKLSFMRGFSRLCLFFVEAREGGSITAKGMSFAYHRIKKKKMKIIFCRIDQIFGLVCNALQVSSNRYRLSVTCIYLLL